jgi:outer membrane protein assembly factor BamB
MAARTSDLEPWRALRHPLWWGALVVLVANDHLLKGAGLLPPIVTGKLSDVAGLVVAPALLATVLGVSRRAALVGCHAVPVLALAALKLVPGLADAAVALAAACGETWAIVADPTDVLAAPAALVSWRVLVPPMRVGGRARPDARALVLAAAGALACGATSRAAPQTPTVVGDAVVVQTWSDGVVLRIDARTGQLLSRLDVPSHVETPAVHDGAIWIATDGRIRALDLTSGAVRWERRAGYTAVGPVDDHTVHAFVTCREDPCEDPRWVAIDRATRRERWSVHGEAVHPPRVGDGVVAIADGPRVVVRDGATGAIRWTRTLGGDAVVVAVSGGVVWAIDVDGDRLHALDAATGLERRRFALADADGVVSPFDPSNPRVAAWGGSLVVVDDGVARLLDPARRAPRWSVPAHAALVSGDVALLATDGGVSCVDAGTARLLWVLPETRLHAVAVSGEHVAVRQGDPWLSVYDVTTGRLRFRFALDEEHIVAR